MPYPTVFAGIVSSIFVFQGAGHVVGIQDGRLRGSP